jgi:hypothetical protein
MMGIAMTAALGVLALAIYSTDSWRATHDSGA